MTTTVEVRCPKCQGPCWDNTLTKTNPKAPDYKCRDRACDGVVWPPKHGAPRAAAPRPAAPAASVKQGYSSGGPLPGEEAAAGFSDGSAPLPTEKLDAIFRVYDVCFQHAFSLAERTMKQDASHEGISAMAATCFIAASERGIGS